MSIHNNSLKKMLEINTQNVDFQQDGGKIGA
jgi:hypothetical protein